jgi:hypothetical protein
MKEIIQRGDVELFSPAEQLDTLHRALISPADKMSQRNALFPTTRFVEDFLFHPSVKLLRRLAIVGFTVNPEHARVEWSGVVRGVERPRLVLFVRGNLVKVAVSGQSLTVHRSILVQLGHLLASAADLRGKVLKEVCGAANIKTTRPDCSVPERMELPVVEGTLLRSVRFWQVRCVLFSSSVTPSTVCHCAL